MTASTARRTRPYRRRRRLPVLVIVGVLAAAAMITWTVVLTRSSGPSGTASCPAPVAGPPSGEPVASDALDGVAPLAPGAVKVKVLNAGGQRGQANLVAAQFGDLGFAEAAPPGNDPFYPDGHMECLGQIRFGPAGEAAASTVALLLPCTELVRDARADDTVDVSVGTAFGDLNPDRAAREALGELTTPGDEADPAAGPPAVDPALLAEARGRTC